MANACLGGAPGNVCDVIQTYYDCLNAAVGLAKGQVPFPVPGDSATTQAKTWYGTLMTSFGGWLQAVAPPGGWQTAAALANIGAKAVGVAGTVLNLASAYRSCVAPHT